MAKKGIQEISADTSILVEKLRHLMPNEMITYEALSQCIKTDVRNKALSNLQSARRIVSRDYNIVVSAVPGIGLKRLDDVGIVSTADHSLSRIHRESKRGLARLNCVNDIEKLDGNSKTKLYTAIAGLGALHEITKTKSIARLEVVVKNTSQERLPLRDTLNAFMK